MSPHEALSLALADAVDRGLRIPCAGQAERFTGEEVDELEAAALECRDCPCRAACEAAGQGQSWGVWGATVAWPSFRPRRAKKAS